MWFVFGRKKKTRAVKGGRRERRKCPECGADATFFEVKVEKTYTAYVAIELFGTESTAFQCSECDEVMDLDPVEPTAAQKAAQAEAEARAEAKAAEERRRSIEAHAKQARAEAAAKEANLDDELAAMKARLGID